MPYRDEDQQRSYMKDYMRLYRRSRKTRAEVEDDSREAESGEGMSDARRDCQAVRPRRSWGKALYMGLLVASITIAVIALIIAMQARDEVSRWFGGV